MVGTIQHILFYSSYEIFTIHTILESESSSFSSESSSESEEYDTGSIDSRDIGPIRLDESVCPKGCDRELYDYTFNLRNKRYYIYKYILFCMFLQQI